MAWQNMAEQGEAAPRCPAPSDLSQYITGLRDYFAKKRTDKKKRKITQKTVLTFLAALQKGTEREWKN